MGTGRVTGENNHAGDLAPLTSPWGQALFDRTSLLIAQSMPIGRQSGVYFHGNVGAMAARSANVQALFVPGGYWGDLPQTEQSTVESPEPWERSS